MEGPKKARRHSDSSLLDLPEVLVISILKQLALKDRIQSEAVCQGFRQLLRKPSQGSFVWDAIELKRSGVQRRSPLRIGLASTRPLCNLLPISCLVAAAQQTTSSDVPPPPEDLGHTLSFFILSCDYRHHFAGGSCSEGMASGHCNAHQGRATEGATEGLMQGRH